MATTTRLRRTIVAALTIAVTVGTLTVADTQPAAAAAQTCIAAKGGSICTSTTGSGTRVNNLSISRLKINPFTGALGGICNYSAWFFYYQPGKPAVGLKWVERAGCAPGRAWITIPVNRNFSRGTQVCAKFYEDHNQFYVGQKCVGIR